MESMSKCSVNRPCEPEYCTYKCPYIKNSHNIITDNCIAIVTFPKCCEGKEDGCVSGWLGN